jgi:SAM-dependent methyltransferase
VGLKREGRNWDDLAVLDPFWAVLSDPARKGGRWQREEFLATGEAEVAGFLRTGGELGYPRERGRALDFGCGVGRITRALSGRFEECCGVDLSARMVELARELNADRANCRFLVNAAPDLRLLESHTFDLVVSVLVLQHARSGRAALRYVAEFLRVVRPGGLVVFQLPTAIRWRGRRQLRRRLYSVLRTLGVNRSFLYESAGLHPVRMIAVPEARVRRVVEAHGGVIALATPCDMGPFVPGFRYFVHLR